MKSHQLIIVISIAATALLSGCANTGYQPAAATASPAQSSNTYATTQYGVVDGIESVAGANSGIGGSSVGAGTIIGAVAGGVLGHQVGGGSGKDLATIAGVVGGAVIGNKVDKGNQQQNNAYNIRVRLNRGGSQTIHVQSLNNLAIGDRVRIDNGQISRY